MNLWKIFAATLLMLAAVDTAFASTICNPFRTPVIQPQLSNCEALVESGQVENTDALEYSIKFMMQNYKGLKDPSCAVDGIFNKDLCVNCKNREWIKKGFENRCSFVLNDMERPWDPSAEIIRSTGYFIDLCSKKKSGLVKKFPMNKAKGAPYDDVPSENLNDKPSNSSVLAGAFLLSDVITNDFDTGHPEDYERIAKRFKGIPAIRMVGLNSSNNTTEFDKPLHISVYWRGNGCPGVDESIYPTMKQIVAKGSSLYMAYAGKRFEQKHIAKKYSCENEPTAEAERMNSFLLPTNKNEASEKLK